MMIVQKKSIVAVLLTTLLVGVVPRLWAGNHEAHFNPANPRPDILPRAFYNAWVPYRKEYNRPTYLGGHIAAIVEPTSQEAMSWRIHHANGDYRCHRPGYIPIYNYPKPWEVLAVHPRPDSPVVHPEGISP